MRTGKVKRLLVAPLDWGLGHATRCIPLIRYIQALGHEVVIAGNESQQFFFGKIFPNIKTWTLKGYNIRYSRRGDTFLPVLLAQLPRLAGVIKQERAWLRKQVQTDPVDGIISDNRYGLYHDHIPSVIMTHQLQIMTGLGHYADQCIRSLHYRYLNRFNEVWIPDVPGYPNLSGALGHPSVMPEHTKYIGLLSQYGPEHRSQPGKHLLILLSGPEPQRSILSDLLWQQALKHPGEIAFVEGSDQAANRQSTPPHITWHKRLTTDELHPLIRDASCVVSRSGYSTLMDLLALDKKAILIPTPGQTEQQYLGAHLHREGIFHNIAQKGFCLENALQQVTSTYPDQLFPPEAFRIYQPVMAEWLNRL